MNIYNLLGKYSREQLVFEEPLSGRELSGAGASTRTQGRVSARIPGVKSATAATSATSGFAPDPRRARPPPAGA